MRPRYGVASARASEVKMEILGGMVIGVIVTLLLFMFWPLDDGND